MIFSINHLINSLEYAMISLDGLSNKENFSCLPGPIENAIIYTIAAATVRRFSVEFFEVFYYNYIKIIYIICAYWY